ncbi:ATP-binding protein [Pontibacter sp. HSC-14F20]|uniref:AAA family ATPase n=1 Tax=Pontibacter sp. HSC-14F20 TaxID=2864136 RepID=UPI001C739F4A|nr:AAA family ATPase [Pontibacter sp. HSC-14F20]MBX0332997.1 ATP-binding protein [Pontibacter sp. HSC-14F20]
MTQITGIGFSNFRVFSQPTFFDLAPITIFTGTNSSGKSSVFKAIKLLNNNSVDPGYLRFTGEGHKLGTFNLAKSRNSDSDTIRFLLKFGDDFLIITDYKATISDFGENSHCHRFMISMDTKLKDNYDQAMLLIDLIPSFDESGYRVFSNLKYLKKRFCAESCLIDPIKLITLIPTLKQQEALEISLQIEGILLSRYAYQIVEDVNTINITSEPIRKTLYELLEELKITDDYFAGNPVNLFDNSELDYSLLPYLKQVDISSLINDSTFRKFKSGANKLIDRISRSIYGTTRNVHYLESIRANSQRLYTNQSQGTAFNELLLNLDKIWSKEENRNLYGNLEFADKWLRKFGIGDKVIINRVKGIATEVVIEKDGHKVDLIDLGYGVTQFLPILLFISSGLELKEEHVFIGASSLFDDMSDEDKDTIPKSIDLPRLGGPLLLIEEPESNLHPKLQSLLADFFIDVAQTFEVTLLIETHSEYLIRRLQVLTASGEVKPEHSVIYYLDGNMPSDSDKFVRKININADGSLTNDFGPGFIDEATNWKLELMRLRNAHLYNVN